MLCVLCFVQDVHLPCSQLPFNGDLQQQKAHNMTMKTMTFRRSFGNLVVGITI
jgi:hypothetical protein